MAERTWYNWYEWLIIHIPESVKKYLNNAKEEIKKIKKKRKKKRKKKKVHLMTYSENAEGVFVGKYTDCKCKDSKKLSVEHNKSDSQEIMIGDDRDEFTLELFNSFLQSYHIGLEDSMKGSDFVFYSIDGLFYKYHKIS